MNRPASCLGSGAEPVVRLRDAVQRSGAADPIAATRRAVHLDRQNLWSTMLMNSVGSRARNGIGPSSGMNSKALWRS